MPLQVLKLLRSRLLHKWDRAGSERERSQDEEDWLNARRSDALRIRDGTAIVNIVSPRSVDQIFWRHIRNKSRVQQIMEKCVSEKTAPDAIISQPITTRAKFIELLNWLRTETKMHTKFSLTAVSLFSIMFLCRSEVATKTCLRAGSVTQSIADPGEWPPLRTGRREPHLSYEWRCLITTLTNMFLVDMTDCFR